jgi:hypothetical protein
MAYISVIELNKIAIEVRTEAPFVLQTYVELLMLKA